MWLCEALTYAVNFSSPPEFHLYVMLVISLMQRSTGKFNWCAVIAFSILKILQILWLLRMLQCSVDTFTSKFLNHETQIPSKPGRIVVACRPVLRSNQVGHSSETCLQCKCSLFVCFNLCLSCFTLNSFSSGFCEKSVGEDNLVPSLKNVSANGRGHFYVTPYSNDEDTNGR